MKQDLLGRAIEAIRKQVQALRGETPPNGVDVKAAIRVQEDAPARGAVVPSALYEAPAAAAAPAAAPAQAVPEAEAALPVPVDTPRSEESPQTEAAALDAPAASQALRLEAGTAVTSTTGLVLDANPALAAMLGVGLEKLVGTPLSAYLTDASRRGFRRLLNALSRQPDADAAETLLETAFQPRSAPDCQTWMRVEPVLNEAGQVSALRWHIPPAAGTIPAATETASTPDEVLGPSAQAEAQEAPAASPVSPDVRLDFRILAEATPNPVWVVQDGLVGYANPAAAARTHRPVEALLGSPAESLLRPEFHGVLQQVLKGQDAQAQPASFEACLESADESECWVEVTATPIQLGGRPALLLTSRDAVPHDLAEQALREAKADLEARVAQRTGEVEAANLRLRSILEALPVGVGLADVSGRMINKNAMMDRVWGGEAPMAESIQDYDQYKGWRSDTGEELKAEDWPIARVLMTGESVVGEVVDVLRFDGAYATLIVSAAPVMGADGTLLGSVLACQDITLQRQIELQSQTVAGQAQQQAEELNTVFRSMADAVVVYDPHGVGQRANPSAVETMGYFPVNVGMEVMKEKIIFRSPDGQIVPEDDWPVCRAMRGEVVHDQQLHVTNAKGRELVVIASASPLFTRAQLSGVVTVWHDVTEREQLTASLEIEQARLKAIIENAPEAILVTDAEGRILLSNPAAGHILGYPIPVGEVYPFEGGPNFSDAGGQIILPHQFPLSRAALYGEGAGDVELMLNQPDGRVRFILANCAPIRDGRGKVTGAVGVFQDITARKENENEIRENAERSEVLASLTHAFVQAGLDHQAVLEAVARSIAISLGHLCTIRLISENGEWLEPAAHHLQAGSLPTHLAEMVAPLRCRTEEPPYDQVTRTGQALLVNDLQQNGWQAALENLWPNASQAGLRSGLFVPLRVLGRQVGMLEALRTDAVPPFTEDDRIFFQDLADRAALAIENARLYEDEAQHAREFNALHSATTALVTTLDLETLLSKILNAALSAIRSADKGMLQLVAPETGHLQVRAVSGFTDPRIQKTSISKSKEWTARAVREKQPMMMQNIPAAPSDGSDMVRSVMVAPLLLETDVASSPLQLDSEVVGALLLTASIPEAFSETDLRLLVSFAATATEAIRNAMLYAEVHRLATTDTLTEQYNRGRFFELGHREVERFRRFGHPLSAIMLDIDNLKYINDTYGHATGDQVLHTLAERCRGSIRGVDILGRYGGDEFAILLPDTDQDLACEIAERIRRAVADRPIMTDQGPVKSSMSLGVAAAAQETTDLSNLLDRADAALYLAKENGKNRVEVA